MAATLSLDTITSSGSGITIDATKTFTVNGTLLTTGSTNVLHKTGDYPIVTGDVASKSELVITATTAGPRNITLPGLAVAGATTCVITIVVSANATGTNSLRVQAGTTEVWTGYQKGDFVRLCISDGAWMVLDHKETYYSYHYLTSDYSIASSADYKLTGWTEVSEIGNTWDSVNNKLVTPTDMNGYWNVHFGIATTNGQHGVEPRLYVAGSAIQYFQHYSPAGAPSYSSYWHGNANLSGEYYATSTQVVEFYIHNGNTAANNTRGTLASATHFTARFNRVY
jgi:hypothetical protein